MIGLTYSAINFDEPGMLGNKSPTVRLVPFRPRSSAVLIAEVIDNKGRQCHRKAVQVTLSACSRALLANSSGTRASKDRASEPLQRVTS